MAGGGEGIQNYVDMAAGVTRATKAKAREAARNLLATAGLEDVAVDATDRATKLAEEVIAASRANRELMGKLIASEVDKAAGRLGFVRADELDEVRRELAELRMSMAHASAHEPAPFAPDLGVPDPPVAVDSLVEPDDPPTIDPITEPPTAPAKTAAKKAAARRTAVRKAPVKKAAAKKAPTAKAAVTAPAKKAAAKKAAVQQTAAKRTPAKKTAETITAMDASDA